MTDPELITVLLGASQDARAVLSMLVQLASSAGDVTLNMSNGATYTLPSLSKMQGIFTADRAADRLAFARDFGGAITAQAITRDTAGLISGITSTLSSGLQIVQTPARNSSGQIVSLQHVVKDALGNVLVTVNRTITRDGAGRYQSIN